MDSQMLDTMRSFDTSHRHVPRTDPLPGRILLGVVVAIALLIGYSLYESSQWDLTAQTNVWLRVAASDGERKFTPTLVDDRSGQVFHERIGPKHCDGGPIAMPLGGSVLANVKTWRDKRDGHVETTLDTQELGERFC